MEPNQNEPRATQDDSTSKVRNGTKSSDTQPALRVVQPSSPPITLHIEVDFKHLDDGRLVELVEGPADATKPELAVFDNRKVYLADTVDYCGHGTKRTTSTQRFPEYEGAVRPPGLALWAESVDVPKSRLRIWSTTAVRRITANER
jgi:hypothetical protein